ncbi:hypothetical protein BS17DRAFT_780530 [Gyrodon lividus]|nr:hypothetical protein BS17DRAFT_780530 [Gyrodon lividus]
MSFSRRLSNIIHCMEQNELSPAGFIQQPINSEDGAHRTARESLFRHALVLLSTLCAKKLKNLPVRSTAFISRRNLQQPSNRKDL